MGRLTLADVLERFLASFSNGPIETYTWGPSQLRVSSYLSQELPPLQYVVSVRAVVVREGQVLTVQDPTSSHILPGGRIESGETLEEALRRELLEETGWSLLDISLLGFKHLHHLTPKPAEHPFPYPDFFQVIYAARPDSFSDTAKEVDGWELDATFLPLDDVRALPLTPGERLFLDEALRVV